MRSLPGGMTVGGEDSPENPQGRAEPREGQGDPWLVTWWIAAV